MEENVHPLKKSTPGKPEETIDYSRFDPKENKLVNIFLMQGFNLEEAKIKAEETNTEFKKIAAEMNIQIDE